MRLEMNTASVHQPGGHQPPAQGGRRGWRDKRRMRAAYVRAAWCAPLNCPNARGAYACPVPAGHMRALFWRFARSVRACHCSTRPNPEVMLTEKTGE